MGKAKDIQLRERRDCIALERFSDQRRDTKTQKADCKPRRYLIGKTNQKEHSERK
jgi:hypothetical protein